MPPIPPMLLILPMLLAQASETHRGFRIITLVRERLHDGYTVESPKQAELQISLLKW